MGRRRSQLDALIDMLLNKSWGVIYNLGNTNVRKALGLMEFNAQSRSGSD